MMNVMGKRKIFFSVSLVLVLAVTVVAIFGGVNLDMPLQGGYMVTYSYEGEVSQDAFQAAVEGLVGQRVLVREAADLTTGSTKLIASFSGLQGFDEDSQQALAQKLSETFPENNMTAQSVNFVEPMVTRNVWIKLLTAAALAALLAALYVGIRFRKIDGWATAVTSLLLVLHDIIIAFAVFLLAGIPFDDNGIAVLLIVFGFSLNNSIVIYNRIRENTRLLGSKTSTAELVNRSVSQCLPRTLMTTIVTVLILSAMAVIAMMNRISPIASLTFSIIPGVIVSAYSSLCVTGPLWALWQGKKSNTVGKKA